MTDTQADLTERARAYGSGREIVDALAGLTGEEGEIVCQEDALIAEIDFALQSEREADAAEARRAAHHQGWDNFRDTLKARIWEHKGEFHMRDAVAIINTHHYAEHGRALASPAPQDDLEGDVKHGNAEYFRAALAHAAAEARSAALEEAARIAMAWHPDKNGHRHPLVEQIYELRSARALASPALQEDGN